MSTAAAMHASDAFGLLCQALAAAAVVRTTLDRLRPGTDPLAAAGIAAATVVAMLAVPLGGASIAMHLRAIIGDPAAVTATLLALAAFAPGLLPARPRPGTLVGTACALGILLWMPVFVGTYPFGFDAYALGWRPWSFVGVGAALAAIAWRRRADGWIAVAGIALLCWGAGIVESDNLWDALVDPWLVGGCLVVGVADGLAARRRAVRPSPAAA
jgi:hypothetical protein